MTPTFDSALLCHLFRHLESGFRVAPSAIWEQTIKFRWRTGGKNFDHCGVPIRSGMLREDHCFEGRLVLWLRSRASGFPDGECQDAVYGSQLTCFVVY